MHTDQHPSRACTNISGNTNTARSEHSLPVVLLGHGRGECGSNGGGFGRRTGSRHLARAVQLRARCEGTVRSSQAAHAGDDRAGANRGAASGAWTERGLGLLLGSQLLETFRFLAMLFLIPVAAVLLFLLLEHARHRGASNAKGLSVLLLPRSHQLAELLVHPGQVLLDGRAQLLLLQEPARCPRSLCEESVRVALGCAHLVALAQYGLTPREQREYLCRRRRALSQPPLLPLEVVEQLLELLRWCVACRPRYFGWPAREVGRCIRILRARGGSGDHTRRHVRVTHAELRCKICDPEPRLGDQLHDAFGLHGLQALELGRVRDQDLLRQARIRGRKHHLLRLGDLELGTKLGDVVTALVQHVQATSLLLTQVVEPRLESGQRPVRGAGGWQVFDGSGVALLSFAHAQRIHNLIER
mmetsp:Transcript_36642/g.117681  ORF Transcript_36642/g.117681 Transcript_36642/m.117681 type:complete len:415 (-) Transcript_36642:623-1867(-)